MLLATGDVHSTFDGMWWFLGWANATALMPVRIASTSIRGESPEVNVGMPIAVTSFVESKLTVSEEIRFCWSSELRFGVFMF